MTPRLEPASGDPAPSHTQRTTFAWRRTALATTAGGLLLMRLALDEDQPLGTLLACAAAILSLGALAISSNAARRLIPTLVRHALLSGALVLLVVTQTVLELSR